MRQATNSPVLAMAMPNAFFPLKSLRSHNPSNRRVRTRMHGGVGGRNREIPSIPIDVLLLPDPSRCIP